MKRFFSLLSRDIMGRMEGAARPGRFDPYYNTYVHAFALSLRESEVEPAARLTFG